MKKLDYVTFSDEPLFQRVNTTIGESDVIFLNIKEVTEDDTEPIYIVFYGINSKPGPGRDEDTMDCACDQCFLDACCEFLFGLYCYAAVVRYFEENCYIATERDAYVVFVAHFNQRLDLHLFENSTAERLRPSQMSRPLLCMKQGSLKCAFEWIKWQIAFGPYADFYKEQNRRKERNKQLKMARNLHVNRDGQL